MNKVDIEQYTIKAQSTFNELYMTAKEVEEKYGISLTRQSQLAAAGSTIVVRIAQRIIYERAYAVWFFDAYVAKQAARVSNKVEGPWQEGSSNA